MPRFMDPLVAWMFAHSLISLLVFFAVSFNLIFVCWSYFKDALNDDARPVLSALRSILWFWITVCFALLSIIFGNSFLASIFFSL